MMKLIIVFFAMTSLMAGCSSNSKIQNQKKQSTSNVTLVQMSTTPLIGTTLSGQKIKLGGFSGLLFAGEKEGALFFQTITDRGPNSGGNGTDHSFLLPEYSPTLVILKADLVTKNLEVSAEIKLKKKDGTPLSGLPNTRLEENPTDVFGLYYSIDQQGLDLEGLTFDGEGGWWMADEYGPSLVRFNESGQVVRRLAPANELPRMYNERQTNRGFEGIAKFENKLFGFLQSPLKNDESSKEGVFSRIVEVDLESMKTSAEYFYPFEKGNNKIGDAVALSAKTFLVLEQNGKIGELSQKFIYRITLDQSDEIVKKTLIADLKSTPFNNVEKVEGLALIDNHRLALIYDNDFQINGKTNQTTGLTPVNDNPNQLLILEFSESFNDDLDI